MPRSDKISICASLSHLFPVLLVTLRFFAPAPDSSRTFSINADPDRSSYLLNGEPLRFPKRFHRVFRYVKPINCDSRFYYRILAFRIVSNIAFEFMIRREK